MTTARKSYANEIEKYLIARPHQNVLVRSMYDDLGMYTTRPNGKRAYHEGSFPLRQVLYGLSTSKAGPREPMPGVEIVTDLTTVPGAKGTGTSWSKVVLRYTPPEVEQDSIAEAEEKTQVFEAVLRDSAPVDLTQVHQQLAAILKANLYTNALLERLVRSWEGAERTPSPEVLEQWASDDEQTEEKH